MTSFFFFFFPDGGQLMVMTTCVVNVKAKMKLNKPPVCPAAQESLVLVGLGSQLSLKPPGGAD